jgi:ABC-type lipoprotein release transport system permease subunit
MQPLMAFIISYKMLFRKGGVTSLILTIALLIAILTSANSIINYINSQTQILTNLVNVSRTYLILNANSTAITDSKIDADLSNKLYGLGYIKYIFSQKMLIANIIINSNNHIAQVRGIDNIDAFFKARSIYINGTIAKELTEANIGEILAKTFSINIGDEVSLEVNGKQVKVRIVGLFKSQTQSDTEIIVPIEITNKLTGNNNTLSIIEFSLKENVNIIEALNKITQLLPRNIKLIQAQQLKEFAQQINMQMLVFLNAWSIAVYAVVVIAFYIIAIRLITESSYELAMLRALGAKKHLIFMIVLAYTATIVFLGSILGIALGIAGSQIASTILGWIMPSINISPFLEIDQALQIILLAFASSIIGCIYPALKSSYIRYMEQPL